MKREKLNEKEYNYIQEEFGIDRATMDKIITEEGDDLEDFSNEILWKDCDAADHLDEGGYTDEDYIVFGIIEKLFSKNPHEDDDFEDDE